MSGPRFVLAIFAYLLCACALAQGVTLPQVERVVLDNGVVLILHEKADVPLIGLEASIRGGAVSDPAGLGGTANLLAGMLERGAGGRSAAEFAEAVDAVGGFVRAGADLESIAISAEFMARDADLMIELLVDMLRAPRLDDDEVRKLRDRNIDVLRAGKDGNPHALTPIYGNGFLFAGHPYGNSVYGSEESLEKITAADLRNYYGNSFGGDRLALAVVGDFETAMMIEKLSDAFADWPAATAPLPVIEAPAVTAGRRVLLVDKPGAAQSYFWIGSVGVGVDDASRAELDIANTLFGGAGFWSSMLLSELRTKAGLTYRVRSELRRNAAGGSVAIISYTKTETTLEAIDLALLLLEQLRADGVSDESVVMGKNYILGQFAPRFETAEQLAGQFAALEGYGLDESYVNDYGAAVAGADGEAIRDIIKEVYPASDDLVFAIIGDAEVIREQVAKYGPLTEMSITEPRFRPK